MGIMKSGGADNTNDSPVRSGFVFLINKTARFQMFNSKIFTNQKMNKVIVVVGNRRGFVDNVKPKTIIVQQRQNSFGNVDIVEFRFFKQIRSTVAVNDI